MIFKEGRQQIYKIPRCRKICYRVFRPSRQYKIEDCFGTKNHQFCPQSAVASFSVKVSSVKLQHRIFQKGISHRKN